MYKRGLSGVITVVLLILITLVGVTIVWLFVQPNIIEILGSGDKDGRVGSLFECVESDLEIFNCGVSENLLTIEVKRGSSDFGLEGIAFLIETDKGIFPFTYPDYPNKFGLKSYLFELSSDLDGSNEIRLVKLAVILEGGSVCDYSSVSLCGGEALTGEGQEPIARFTASPDSGFAPLTVSFDASSSYDPDGTISEYRWDWENDGTIDAYGELEEYTFDSGEYDVNLTVVDNDGLKSSFIDTIEVFTSLSDSECNDGIDNDGNGRVDFEDFGCWGLNGQETSLNYGWTLLEPRPEAFVFFVSTSGINDNCPGYTISQLETMNEGDVVPCKTLDGARRKLRDRTGDWLLLKRGDVFNDDYSYLKSGKNGYSEQYPIVFGSYGSSIQRPIVIPPLTPTAEHGFFEGASTRENLAIIGIHFKPEDGVPTNKIGIFITSSDYFRNILIEDNKIERFVDGMIISGTGSLPNQGIYNAKIRRNIIVDCSADLSTARAQGAYLQHIDELLLEGNVFDHNGWSLLDPPDTQNHNIYIQDPGNFEITTLPVVRNNIFSQGAASGIQVRTGGDVINNLFTRNALAMHTSRKGGIIRDNVILEGRDIDANAVRGFGITVNPTEFTLVENNIIAHRKIASQYGRAISLDDSANGVTNNQITIQNNIVYNWDDLLFQITDSDNLVYDNIKVLNNIFQDNNGKSLAINHVPSIFDPIRFSYSGNKYWISGLNNDGYVRVGGSLISWADWQVQSGDTSSIEQTIFPDPERDVESYDSSIGGSGTFESFIQGARGQSKFNWNEDYTANSFNNYIREGFGR